MQRKNLPGEVLDSLGADSSEAEEALDSWEAEVLDSSEVEEALDSWEVEVLGS